MIGRDEDKNAWNEFVAANRGSFLQSYEWAEFQGLCGRKVHLLDEEDYKAVAIQYSLPFHHNYLYVPRGPVFRNNSERARNSFLENLKELAQKEKSIFVRMDPPFFAGTDPTKLKGFHDIGRSIQPRRNLIINLEPSEEALLAAMREKTRYNIRVAQKHGIIVKALAREELRAGGEIFWQLVSETAKRQDIKIYKKEYYDKMLETFCIVGTDPTMQGERNNGVRGEAYVAYYQQRPLAAAFVVFFGRRATYLHGGSTQLTINGTPKNVMAPYALHWEAMRQAKAEGCREYDFGGIDEKRWPGVTRFKTGFSGTVEEYQNAFDLPISKSKYYLYNLARKIRR